MDARERLVQRYVDGVCNRAEAAAVESMTAQDPALAGRLSALRRLDGLMQARTRCLPVPRDREDLIAAIVDALPSQSPARQTSLAVGQIVGVAAAVAFVAVAAGLARSSPLRQLLDLTLVSSLAIILGLVFVLLARPLRDAEGQIFGRLLRRRVRLNAADVVATRVVGIAVILGGLYVMGVL